MLLMAPHGFRLLLVLMKHTCLGMKIEIPSLDIEILQSYFHRALSWTFFGLQKTEQLHDEQSPLLKLYLGLHKLLFLAACAASAAAAASL